MLLLKYNFIERYRQKFIRPTRVCSRAVYTLYMQYVCAFLLYYCTQNRERNVVTCDAGWWCAIYKI